MKNLKYWLVLAGAVAALGLVGGRIVAQDGPPPGGRPPFDPKMLVDNLREPLEVTDDAEWKVISERAGKVIEARMKVGLGGGMGMMNLMRGRRGGDGGGQGGGNGGGGRRGGGFGGMFSPGPEAEALQTAIDNKASKAELRAAVDKFVEVRKAKQAALDKAQADLRELLSYRQEAIAYNLGLL